jgi:hypothetical protein
MDMAKTWVTVASRVPVELVERVRGKAGGVTVSMVMRRLLEGYVGEVAEEEPVWIAEGKPRAAVRGRAKCGRCGCEGGGKRKYCPVPVCGCHKGGG